LSSTYLELAYFNNHWLLLAELEALRAAKHLAVGNGKIGKC
jgi:hypothetical protein